MDWDWQAVGVMVAGVLGVVSLTLSLVTRRDQKASRAEDRAARIDIRGFSGGSNDQLGTHLICTIVNVGAVTALNIRAAIYIGGERFPAHRVLSMMPAGSAQPEQRLSFGVPREILAPSGGSHLDIPALSTIRVRYVDGLGKEREVTFPLVYPDSAPAD